MTSVAEQIVTNSNYTTIANAQNKTENTTNTISSDTFLNLMCMQLQYQDPTNPLDNSEMLAQEAQFTTLEQMEKLVSSFSQFSNVYQANSLIGQNVEIMLDSESEPITGKVDYVDLTDTSGASVSVNGRLFPLSSVTKVFPNESTTSSNQTTQTTNNSSSTDDKFDLLKTAIDAIGDNIGNIANKLNQYITQI